MSNVEPIDVNFISVILTKRAEFDFIFDYCRTNLDASDADAQEVLQHHKKADGTFLPSLLAVEFIKGRRWSKKCAIRTSSSPATILVTIR